MVSKAFARDYNRVAKREGSSKRISASPSNSKPTVYNPATGRSWGSVEEYVKDPKKYGGGSSGGSSRSVSQEIAKRQAASQAAAQAEAQRKVEAQRQAEIQRKAQQQAQQRQVAISSAKQRPISFQETRMDTLSNVPQRRITIDPTQQSSSYISPPKEKKGVWGTIKKLYKKEANIPIFGLGGVGYGKSISTEDIGEELAEKGGTTGKVVDVLLPKTYGELAVMTAIGGAYQYGSPAVRLGLSGYGTYTGGKMALDPSLPKEERIVGGVVGGLSSLGFAYEVTPYVRGGIAKLSPKYKPIVYEGKVGTVQGVDLKLIPPGNKLTGATPAYESTAYGFSRSYQTSYVGKTGTVTTTAKNLVGLQNKYLGKNIQIISRETGVGFSGQAETFGAFGTPFDLNTGYAQTRVSRLGGATSIKDFFLGFRKDSGVSFKLTSDKPQFVLFEDATISRTGGQGTFKYGGKLSTELEVTTVPGSVITSIQKIGVTTKGGQAIEIFSARLGGARDVPLSIANLKAAGLSTSTSLPGQTSSAFGLGGSLFSTSSQGSNVVSTPTYTSITPPVSSPIVSSRASIISIIPLTSVSRGTGRGGSSPPRIISPPVRLPTITSPPKTPSRPPRTPSLPRVSSIPRRSIIPRRPYYPRVSTTKKGGFFFGSKSKLPKLSGGFQVFGRRFGKWKPVGVGRTQSEAFSLGKKFASGTLGATFRIPKSKVLKLPGYRTKKTKEGILFIEPSKKRLKKRGTEVKEIQFYKGLKRRSK